MNILEKFKKNSYTISDVLEALDSKNPILIYNSCSLIVDKKIEEEIVVDKLRQLSSKLNNESKILGFYKVGHFAMATLLGIGISQEEVFKDIILDEFDKETTVKIYKENNW